MLLLATVSLYTSVIGILVCNLWFLTRMILHFTVVFTKFVTVAQVGFLCHHPTVGGNNNAAIRPLSVRHPYVSVHAPS